MQDLKRNRKKIVNQPAEIKNVTKEVIDEIPEELDRSCKHKHNNECDLGQKCECECICKPKKPDCEPCQIEADECIANVCGPECCNPIAPDKCSVANSIPYAIEVNRIYDTFKFQLFTDGNAPQGRNLYFDYEVVEVRGHVPKGAPVNITIDKICMNYSDVIVKPGCVTLEDHIVTPIKQELEDSCYEDPCPGFGNELDSEFCETTFEYNVCGDRNTKCCKQGKGERSNFKEKGLKVIVKDLVLELQGKCGCTEVTILAYPAKKTDCGKLEPVHVVVFEYNTLSAACCLPANGKSVVLRQEFQTALTVDCIGKCLLKVECCGCECDYEVCIPNGIDLICCLEEVVSILVSEQIVVLGSAAPIQPRIVDTFAKVCEFTGCEPEQEEKKHHGCGCK